MEERLANHHHQERPREARPPESKEKLPWVDLSRLEPIEVFDAYRYAHKTPGALREAIDEVLKHLPSMNLQRAIEIFTTGIDSRDPQDRMSIAHSKWLFELAKVDHDAGLELLHQIHRDYDDKVREAAHKQLIATIITAAPKGIGPNHPEPYLIPKLDEQQLVEETGLTRVDVDALLHANGKADVGEGVYDPGLEALSKIPDIELTERMGVLLPEYSTGEHEQ